jgi:CubicO group peptidase (beta-lactamase class C family)
VAQTPTLIVIQEPEKELSAAFTEVVAPTVEDAITDAWKRWRPDFDRKVRQTAKPPVTQGWDEVAQNVYETGADERRIVIGAARRKGKTYYVTLVDGALSAAERRGAQLNIAIGSLKVADHAEENLAGRKPHPLDAARLEKFLGFAESAREMMKIPGVAIAVIQNGKIVLEKGLGVRELNKPAPVTPQTLFMIGSMTKPLTSLMMARLVDRGAFAWETPVTSLLPSFALGDPEATKRVTMAHTVCACTGLPRWDMEFIFEWNDSTAQKRVDLLKGMKPTTGFGETFQYSNLMVATGGYVAAMTATKSQDLEKAYVDAMTTEVLRPLGMSSTALDLDVAMTREHAVPHGRTLVYEVSAIPTALERGVDSVMPAGGAWSTVGDISRWLMLELANGRVDNRTVITEKNLLERRKPRAQISAKQSYGLALFVDESRGLTAIGHGGNTFGFSADATFYPEHGLGVVVLTNVAAANAYTGAVRRRLIELLFDATEEAEKGLAFGLKQTQEAIKMQMAEVSTTPDAAFVGPAVGVWTNPRLGRIEIRREANGFIFDAGEWKSAVGEHKDKTGVRRILLTDPPFAGLAFWPQSTDGKPALLFETAQQKYLFERQGR